MRLGLYGGSFDPVHIGHLILAETARDQLKLDRVEFIPLGVPPHLKNVRVNAEIRYKMLQATLEPYSEFGVSRREIETPGKSYTVDTLRFFHEKQPDDLLFLILSSETFNDLPNWKEPKEICELASIVIAQRAGFPEPDFDAARLFASEKRISEFKKQVITAPMIEVSSSLIRKKIANNESVRFQVPEPALNYIRNYRLYQFE